MYTMIFVLLFLSLGLGNAFVNTPLSVYDVKSGYFSNKNEQRNLFAKINMHLSLFVGLIIGLFMFLWQGDQNLALSSGFLGTTFLWRHFSRGINFAQQTPLGATKGDFAYAISGSLALGFVLLQNDNQLSLGLVFNVLSFSCIFSLVFTGNNFLKLQFLDFYKAEFAKYYKIWQESARWILFGVLSTEATVNSHGYIISFLAGPQAFAPLAAAAVLFKPLGVIINSLNSLERPRLAVQFINKNVEGFKRTSIQYLVVLLLCWLCICIGVFIFWPWLYTQLFVGKYDSETIILALILWACVFFVNICRSLPSLIMQSKIQFKRLSFITIITAPITVISVIFLYYYFGTIVSVGGILLGEISFLFLIVYALRKNYGK